MISSILIFPIIACVLMYIIRNKTFDKLMFNAYAILQFVLTVLLMVKKPENNQYFGLDPANTVFLLVLSFVFLMVAIYNNGYLKTLNFGRVADVFII